MHKNLQNSTLRPLDLLGPVDLLDLLAPVDKYHSMNHRSSHHNNTLLDYCFDSNHRNSYFPDYHFDKHNCDNDYY